MELGDWRQNILSQLQKRNREETYCFQDLITQHNKVFENANSLKHENIQLSIQNEKLRVEGGGGNRSNSATELKLQEEVQQLKQKLFTQAEELTELHRKKSGNIQEIIDLNVKLQDRNKAAADKEIQLAEAHSKIISLEAEIGMLTQANKQLQYLNDTLRDEHQALQLAFSALEDKLRKVQEENRQLVERLIKYKAKDADRMNEENDNFLNEGASKHFSTSVLSTFGIFRKRYAKMQKDLEEACRDTKGVSSDDLSEGYGPLSQSTLPSKVHLKFDAHEGEVNAIKWSPLDRIFATGGADRKVKLWDISKGIQECKGVLVGSNAGVMAVDFDASGSLVLGASNDYATRVWTVVDQRLRHTLTGHSGKVMAAKFLGDASKVVTGSHDRTLKVWDLKSRACIETKFAGSSCNDLVTVDSAGSTIISGHYDKTIRFWDSRSETSANNINLNGKITSLDLSRDSKYLLACVRDDTLELIDLRMNQVVTTYNCDGFKVGCDWSRATFSPDGQYVAVGSSDGSVYIWGVTNGKIETILKEHGSAVTATAWHPFGNFLATVDRTKRSVIWTGDM
ncbi:autophagy-related protein 16-1 isoform X2 [Anthonomus grandis grandis]|uniref:autophagy-related protein 16-1 isoform X2 n=1 Tax=Anthonomus grandis grandis TaxID=2921223 RepID=UPI002166BC18|nr:autophagy-related protein 16-1 isoform X2 [Anthonomus grandis grandis]